jgi:hypothetical protein
LISTRPYTQSPPPELVLEAIKRLSLNHLLIYPALTYIGSIYYIKATGLAITLDLPSPLTILWQLVACMLVEDALFAASVSGVAQSVH